MDVMDRPRTRHTHREPDPVSFGEEAQAEAERVYWSLDDDVHAELIQGEVVVNAAPMNWHQRVVNRLGHVLTPFCDEKSWDVLPDINFLLGTTHEIFRPDLTIAGDVDELAESDSGVPAECAKLVIEITSASTRQRDLVVKRKSYAENGVPLFMIVDRFVDPPAVTLFSKPGDRDYTDAEMLTFGPGGEKLTLPEPFGVTLDLSAIPVPRA
jgi:Uma2 family endonuclease